MIEKSWIHSFDFFYYNNRLFCWHLMRATMSRYFTHVNVMKVALEILLLVFRTSRMLIILKLDWDSICFSVCVTIISQFEKFSPCYIDNPVWSFNTNIPVGEASILIYYPINHHFDILVSGWVLKKPLWSFAVAEC